MGVRRTDAFLCTLLRTRPGELCDSSSERSPKAAREKLSRELQLGPTQITALWPCIFAVTPVYIRRAEFTECAFVQTDSASYVARAIPSEQRFEKVEVLSYSTLRGFNLRNWGLGASQLQFLKDGMVVTVHLKSGGRESMDQPSETAKVAAHFRSKNVPEVESPGRVDPAVSSVIPIIIPVR